MDQSTLWTYIILMTAYGCMSFWVFCLLSLIKNKNAKIKRLESGEDTDLIKLANIIIETSENVPEEDAFKIAKKIINLGWQIPPSNL